MRLVDAQELHAEAPDAVPGDVDGEQAGRLQAEPLVHEQQHDDPQEAPERLVEEGRVEGLEELIRPGPVLERDLDGPRQVGGLAEELLVEVVAPAPDRLREQEARSDRVHERVDALPGAVDDPGPDEHTGADAAPDAEAALPDREGLPPLVVDGAPARDHVVDARANDAGEHAPHGHAEDEVSLRIAPERPAARPAPARQQGGSDDAEEKHEPVGMDLERAEVDLAAGRARKRAQDRPEESS